MILIGRAASCAPEDGLMQASMGSGGVINRRRRRAEAILKAGINANVYYTMSVVALTIMRGASRLGKQAWRIASIHAARKPSHMMARCYEH